MKRALFLCTVFLMVATTAGAQKATSPKLRDTLERGLKGELEAVIRYEAFAAKADEEGYAGAAALFRAAAHAEGVHAGRFTSALKERDLPVPEPAPYTPQIGSTGDNLRSSASLETGERDGIYREAVAASREAKDEKLALYFDQTRDTEVEHANLMATAARQLEQYRAPRKYYVCGKCGYTSDLDLPFCVLCRVEKHPGEVE